MKPYGGHEKKDRGGRRMKKAARQEGKMQLKEQFYDEEDFQ